MTATSVLWVAIITVATRLAAVAFLPPPEGRLAQVVARLPAPLFGALAAYSLLGSGGEVDVPMLVGVGCAVLATRSRSLLVVLAAGIGGFLLADLVW